MAQPSYLNIIRRTVDSWDFESDLFPLPHGADGYHGNSNGDGTVSFTDKNGSVVYNHVPYTLIEYIDEYDFNDHTPTSAEELIYFLKAEGFFDESGSDGSGGSTTFIGLTDVSVTGGYGVNQGKVFIVQGSGLVPVTPSFAFQNNKVTLRRKYFIGFTGAVTATMLADFYNDASTSFTVSETEILVVEGVAGSGSSDTIYVYLFKPGKGTWGTTGGGQTLLAQHFQLTAVRNFSPTDIENTPNSFIYNLGDTTGADFWEAGNDQNPPYDLTDSGDLDADGNPRTYYFSYTDNGILYYAQFVGAQGYYGLDENQFVETDFVDTTNDTVTPLPDLQQVTTVGNTTTHGIVAMGGGYQISYTNQTIEFRDISGNILRLRMPSSLPVGEVTFDFPEKTIDDTFAMISDLGGLGMTERRVLYTAVGDTDAFIVSDLIGASQIEMISSNVSGNTMSSSISFNSSTGEISGYPVLTGEEHLIFYLI